MYIISSWVTEYFSDVYELHILKLLVRHTLDCWKSLACIAVSTIIIRQYFDYFYLVICFVHLLWMIWYCMWEWLICFAWTCSLGKLQGDLLLARNNEYQCPGFYGPWFLFYIANLFPNSIWFSLETLALTFSIFHDNDSWFCKHTIMISYLSMLL